MNKKGFTLIELLIVVTIIGILAVALVPRIVGSAAGARDATRRVDVQNIAKGLEVYLSDNGDFDDIGDGGNVAGEDYCVSDLSDDLEPLIGSVPRDPDGNRDATIDGLDAVFDATGICSGVGEYIVTFLDDEAGDLNKYAIAAFIETAEEGDPTIIRLGLIWDPFTDYSELTSLAWGDEGTYDYYILY